MLQCTHQGEWDKDPLGATAVHPEAGRLLHPPVQSRLQPGWPRHAKGKGACSLCTLSCAGGLSALMVGAEAFSVQHLFSTSFFLNLKCYHSAPTST